MKDLFKMYHMFCQKNWQSFFVFQSKSYAFLEETTCQIRKIFLEKFFEIFNKFQNLILATETCGEENFHSNFVSLQLVTGLPSKMFQRLLWKNGLFSEYHEFRHFYGRLKFQTIIFEIYKGSLSSKMWQLRLENVYFHEMMHSV